MNIEKEIKLNVDKPAVLPIKKSEKVNLFAVGLLKGQLLAEHSTSLPTLITVLKGTIAFRLGDEEIVLHEYDTFEIPVNEKHEVEGLRESNLFLLAQEK